MATLALFLPNHAQPQVMAAHLIRTLLISLPLSLPLSCSSLYKYGEGADVVVDQNAIVYTLAWVVVPSNFEGR